MLVKDIQKISKNTPESVTNKYISKYEEKTAVSIFSKLTFYNMKLYFQK